MKFISVLNSWIEISVFNAPKTSRVDTSSPIKTMNLNMVIKTILMKKLVKILGKKQHVAGLLLK